MLSAHNVWNSYIWNMFFNMVNLPTKQFWHTTEWISHRIWQHTSCGYLPFLSPPQQWCWRIQWPHLVLHGWLTHPKNIWSVRDHENDTWSYDFEDPHSSYMVMNNRLNPPSRINRGDNPAMTMSFHCFGNGNFAKTSGDASFKTTIARDMFQQSAGCTWFDPIDPKCSGAEQVSIFAADLWVPLPNYVALHFAPTSWGIPLHCLFNGENNNNPLDFRVTQFSNHSCHTQVLKNTEVC